MSLISINITGNSNLFVQPLVEGAFREFLGSDYREHQQPIFFKYRYYQLAKMGYIFYRIICSYTFIRQVLQQLFFSYHLPKFLQKMFIYRIMIISKTIHISLFFTCFCIIYVYIYFIDFFFCIRVNYLQASNLAGKIIIRIKKKYRTHRNELKFQGKFCFQISKHYYSQTLAEVLKVMYHCHSIF